MERARQKDSVERDWSHVKSEDEWGPTMTIEFVLLRTPLLSPHDPETIVVSQELSADPSFPEILWNFSRYKGPARITLEQNPHFYLRCPADESTYSPKFRCRPLQDPGGAFEHNDTVYVLFDRPGRVFLTTEHKLRIFGNVWSLNGSLIFRNRSGELEGEQLVRSFSIPYDLWYCEQSVVHQDSESGSRLNHSRLQPVVTTPLDDSPTETPEDWTFLSRPVSHSINIPIYHSRGSTSSLNSTQDLTPPPPTSGRPGYPVLYTPINALDDDVLLGVFGYYRLNDEKDWNVGLGWRKLSHVCQRWRHLIYESAFHLGMHILCTIGTPIVGTLDHLPPLPLFIDYQYTNVNIREQDELGIYHALRLRNRIHRIDLRLPPSILRKFLIIMDGSFPLLEHLSLSSTVDKTIPLALPKTFLAPNLRHLVLVGIGLPRRLRLLLSTASLTTLALTNLRASGYFLPRLLVARLQSLYQLEGLSISFSIPIPRPSAERELLGKIGTPVTLPSLKYLRFQGTSAYLECLVAQIRTPLLERFDITLFNQIAFALPHLTRFIDRTEGLKLPIVEAFFGRDEVSMTLGHRGTLWDEGRFTLRVICKQLDWQIDCAAQICRALMPVLSGVEKLTLDYYEMVMPTEWQNGEIDGTTWHELLRPFIWAKDLRICSSLSGELSRALQVDSVGMDPGLLPSLQNLACGSFETFRPFIYARWAAGYPVWDWDTARTAVPLGGRAPPGFVPHFASFLSRSLSSTTTDSSNVMSPPSITVQLPSRSPSVTGGK
ncbi:hypothetical protein H4582DRAFT_1104928 [Lactarius indigo]|nr:hypothetical protein H4582DRAFT_1104928 [Lactarius indigo]